MYTVSSYLWKLELFKNIGIELSAAGFIAILLELILREEFLDEIKNELRAPLKALDSGRELSLNYIKIFRSASEMVDIIALSFTTGIEQYYKYLDQKICEENCKIRILLLDYNSPAFEARSRDEFKGSPEKLKTYINKNKKYLNKTIKKFKAFNTEFFKKHGKDFRPGGSLRVKTYRGIPYFGYFRVDNHCVVTPYFSFGYGIESPVFEIRNPNSSFFKQFERHFNILWGRDDSKTIIDIGEF